MGKILYAFYDLSVSPPTYDIIKFLLMAELIRIREKFDHIHIIYVPGHHQGFRNDPPDHTINESILRAKNILIGSCYLIKSCKGFTYCSERSEAAMYLKKSNGLIFPEHYSLEKPIPFYSTVLIKSLIRSSNDWPSIQAPSFAKEIIDAFSKTHVNEKEIVTINLRISSTQPLRNSNLVEWNKVAKELLKKGFFVMTITDHSNSFSSLPKYLSETLVTKEFIWDISLRAAIYEKAVVNLFVSNGPALLSLHNQERTTCLVFKLVCEDYDNTSSKYFKRIGLKVGTQPLYAGKYNRFIWTDDDYTTIINEFDNLYDEIKNKTQSRND